MNNIDQDLLSKPSNQFVSQYWGIDHCDPDSWDYVPSTYGVKGVHLVGTPEMKLFSELTGNWTNPGRSHGINLGKCEEMIEDIRDNGIDTKNGSMIYWDVDDSSKINAYHREYVTAELKIPGWMGQGVRFDNEKAKIIFACKSNNRKELIHNNTSVKDVESTVRRVLELESTYTKKEIQDKVHYIGDHFSTTTRNKIVNNLLVEFISKGLKSGERYTPHNADTVWRLLNEIDNPWVEDYYKNEDEVSNYVYVKNFDSRIGSIITQASIARTNNAPLHMIFSVEVPTGKETLDSKREKVFSTWLPRLEDKLMNLSGQTEMHRANFPWNHPDAEHRFVAQDNNKEKFDSLIKIPNRSYN